MNDRFEFRMWDKYREEYIYFDFTSLSGALADIEVKIIEQCTGLKDMSDNLVYENDFIDSDSVLYHVVFIDGAFVANPVMIDIKTTIPLKVLQPFCIVGTVHNYVGTIHDKGEIE